MGFAASCCTTQESSEPSPVIQVTVQRLSSFHSRCASRLVGDDRCCCEEVQKDAPNKLPRGRPLSHDGNSVVITPKRPNDKASDKRTPSPTSNPARKSSSPLGSPVASRTPSKERQAYMEQMVASALASARAAAPPPSIRGSSTALENEKSLRYSCASEMETEEVSTSFLYKMARQEGDMDKCLLIGAYFGDVDMVRDCLQQDALPTALDSNGFWAGYHAATRGSLETLQVLIDADTHQTYCNYFENQVTRDQVTPIMAVLQQGHLHVYEYLVKEVGCILKLKAEALATDAFEQPLHEWLDLVPEICHQNQTPQRSPLRVRGTIVDSNRPLSEEAYLAVREQRLKVRDVVRKVVLMRQNAANRETNSEEYNDDVPLSSRHNNKRGAVAMALEKSGVKKRTGVTPRTQNVLNQLLPKYDVEASVVSGGVAAAVTIRPRRGKASPDVSPRVGRGSDCVWVCGSCTYAHKEPLSQTSVFQCRNCSSRNLVRFGMTSSALESPYPSDGDDDVEVWGNSGKDVTSEKIVNGYLKLFKGCVFMHIGARRLRQLLRISKLEVKQENDVLFKDGEEIKCIYVLENGTATIQERFKAKDGNFVQREITVDKESKLGSRSVAQVIDMGSYIKSRTQKEHQTTCRVVSKTAKIFAFPKGIVEEECNCDLATIIYNALSMAVVSAIPLFRLAFDEDERLKLSEKLTYHNFDMGRILVTQGQRVSGLTLVQRGIISVSNGTTTRVVHVSPQQEEVPEVTAIRGGCEAWTIEKMVCDGLFGNGNLLQHLQIGIYLTYLSRVIFFRKLRKDDPRFRKLVHESNTLEFWIEESMILQGTMGESLFLLIEGTVEVIVDGKIVMHCTADIDQDKIHTFGEITILDPAVRTATLRVASDSATALEVTRDSVNEVFGSVNDLLQEQNTDTVAVIQEWNDKTGGRDLGMHGRKSEEHVDVDELMKRGEIVFDGIYDSAPRRAELDYDAIREEVRSERRRGASRSPTQSRAPSRSASPTGPIRPATARDKQKLFLYT